MASVAYWYAFECSEPQCLELNVIFDVRRDGESTPEICIKCPFCEKPVECKEYWSATQDGYGSRSEKQ